MDTVVVPLKEFAKNSVRLVKRCTKPDRRGEDFGLCTKLAGGPGGSNCRLHAEGTSNAKLLADAAVSAVQNSARSVDGQPWALLSWAS